MLDYEAMNDPIRRFEAEHQDALGELARLEAAATALEEGEDPETQIRVVREVHAALCGPVREHNENEERALFPFLGAEAPIELFEEEHRELRALEVELARAAAGPRPEVDVPPPARRIVDLLRAHIAREDEMLFPMAREMLGSAGLARVAAELEAGPAAC